MTTTTTGGNMSSSIEKRWYTVAEVAAMLGFGLSKTKMLIATGKLRSLKDGRHRRVLLTWVDEYVERRAREWAA
jgi:excisionase family DNA binding protein